MSTIRRCSAIQEAAPGSPQLSSRGVGSMVDARPATRLSVPLMGVHDPTQVTSRKRRSMRSAWIDRWMQRLLEATGPEVLRQIAARHELATFDRPAYRSRLLRMRSR